MTLRNLFLVSLIWTSTLVQRIDAFTALTAWKHHPINLSAQARGNPGYPLFPSNDERPEDLTYNGGIEKPSSGDGHSADQPANRFSKFAPSVDLDANDFRAQLRENMKADLERRRREDPTRGNQPAKSYLDSL